MDTLLLGILILAMGIVVIFAIGVEIGYQNQKPIIQNRTPLTRAARMEAPKPKEAEKPIPAKVAPEKQVSGRFTVQVASFGGTEAAREALEQMKRKGIQEAFLIEGTRQTAVCIGGYESRSEADRALSELKKSFKDAFVRNR